MSSHWLTARTPHVPDGQGAPRPRYLAGHGSRGRRGSRRGHRGGRASAGGSEGVRPTGDPRQHRAERARPRDRRRGDVRRPGDHDPATRRSRLRRGHPHHPVRVHRSGAHAVRHGRRERAPGGDPGRPRRGRSQPGARAARRPDRDRRLGAVRHGGLGTLTVARGHVLQRQRRRRARVPRGGRDDPVRRARLHLHGRHPRPEDHAVHALLAVDRSTDRLDRLHARVLGDLGGDRRRRRLGVRRVVGAGARDRRVRLAEGTASVPARAHGRGHPGGTHRAAPALRGPPRPRHAVLAADLLDRPVRALAAVERPGRRRRGPGRRVQRRVACRTGVVPVPHERLAHVQPVRGRPAPPRRARRSSTTSTSR